MPDEVLLLLSIAILFAGPVLYRLARTQVALLAALDGFLFVAIGGLVLFNIMPEAFGQAGWPVLIFALAGFLGPSAIEHSFHRAAKQAHGIAIFLGIISLGLHALADGAALVGRMGPGGAVDQSLPLAVVLHRIPDGLIVWWLLRPPFGRRVAGGALLLIAVSTLAGFHFATQLVESLSGQALGCFQALVAGSLLHVVVHRTEKLHSEGGVPADRPRRRQAAGAGAVAGLALLAALTAQEYASSPTTGAVLETFRYLSLESAPALLLAYLTAGLMAAFLPAASVRWMNRGKAWSQSLRGMAVGLPLPVCSCGVVPLFQTLNRQGASAPAALAFLIATPELSLDAVFLSVPLLGTEMTLLRVAGAAAVALLTGWTVGTWFSGAPPAATADGGPGESQAVQAPFLQRLRAGMKVGLGEVVDHTAPWMLLGLAVAAVLEPSFRSEWLRQLPDLLEVPVFALLGMPTYVCASGATPLVAVLLAKGVSPGAALAFLLTGPATNVTTFGVLSSALGRRTAIAFAVAAALFSIAAGLAANWVVQSVQPPALADAGEASQTFQWICLTLLGFLFLLSLLRQGPRGFVNQIISLD